MFVALALVVLLAVSAVLAMRRSGANLAAEYAELLGKVSDEVPSQQVSSLSLTDIAKLPEPVQRYLQRSGAVGKAPVRAFYAFWDAQMFQAPGSSAMPRPSRAVQRRTTDTPPLFHAIAHVPPAGGPCYTTTPAGKRQCVCAWRD